MPQFAASSAPRDQVSRAARSPSPVKARTALSSAWPQLAHSFAQTGASLALARFVGKRVVLGSVERSLRETPARAARQVRGSRRKASGCLGSMSHRATLRASQASLENSELLNTTGWGWGPQPFFKESAAASCFLEARNNWPTLIFSGGQCGARSDMLPRRPIEGERAARDTCSRVSPRTRNGRVTLSQTRPGRTRARPRATG
jgi:hypothetical protein